VETLVDLLSAVIVFVYRAGSPPLLFMSSAMFPGAGDGSDKLSAEVVRHLVEFLDNVYRLVKTYDSYPPEP